MRTLWLFLIAVPFYFTSEGSEIPPSTLRATLKATIIKAKLGANLDKFFSQYEAGTLTPDIVDELKIEKVLKKVPWALSRIKENQEKILSRAEQTTKEESSAHIDNQLIGLIVLQGACTFSRRKNHPLENAFQIHRINKEVNRLITIRNTRNTPQQTSPSLALLIIGIVLGSYGLHQYLSQEKSIS